MPPLKTPAKTSKTPVKSAIKSSKTATGIFLAKSVGQALARHRSQTGL